MVPKAKNVLYQHPHKLWVEFVNGEQKVFDLMPYLSYSVYENLRDEVYCAKAGVKDGIVVWDEMIDLDPDRLYHESMLFAP